MSIFGNIASAIFGHKAVAAPASQPAPGQPATAPPAAAPATPKTGTPDIAQASAPSAAPAAASEVDVAAVLDKAVSAQSEKLAWRTSIVDLMKALKLNSSQSARKELAGEMQYTGDMNDSAKMNIWLHKQVMQKLAANGGKVPPEFH